MKINKKVIEKLKPCKDRWENYLKHYSDFDGDIEEFFELSEITHKDKLWVALRLMDRFSVECFAIDCAVRAAAYADVVYTYAADAAAYAAYACEREVQLQSILRLVKGGEL